MSEEDIRTEERLVYGVIAIVSAPVLLDVTIARSPFDGGSTLTLLLFAAALIGLVVSLRRPQRRLPRAHVRPDNRT